MPRPRASGAIVHQVFAAAKLADDPSELHPAERAFLAGAKMGPSRAREWTRGRLAVRELIRRHHDGVDAYLLTADDGAPELMGLPGYAVSLSHDGVGSDAGSGSGAGFVAVALGPPGVAIDLAVPARAAVAARVLAHLGLGDDSTPPLWRWVALEAALKHRRLSVTTLLARCAHVHPAPDERGCLVVTWRDRTAVRVAVHDVDDYVLGVTAGLGPGQ